MNSVPASPLSIRDCIAVVLVSLVLPAAIHLVLFVAHAFSSDALVSFHDNRLHGLTAIFATPTVGLFALLYLRRKDPARFLQSSHDGLGVSLPTRPWIFPSVLAATATIAATVGIAHILIQGHEEIHHLSVVFDSLSRSEGFLFFLTAVLVGPAVEEFIYRGAVFGALAGRYGLKVACAGSLIFFWVMHLPTMLWDVVGQIQIALVSAACVALRVRFRSIAPAILLHSLYNLFATLGLYLVP